jgi:hypothetical protein
MKIYTKRGNKNYKEKRLLKDLEPFIQKRMNEDPNFENQFLPATNYLELEKMHQKYIVEDVEIEEETIKSNLEEEEKTIKNMAKKNADVEDVEFDEMVEDNTKETKSNSNGFIDPFNREEPIVRDYVMNGGFKEEIKSTEQPKKTFFAEPTSFDEAFVIPEDGEETEQKPKAEKTEKRERPTSEPLNPNFDEMSAGKKKRSTKKFAKYIVEAVATLSEKGFVWYANQDINDAKLAEYEMSGEMDLSLLVSLEDGQEVTVKQFFQVQCEKAENLAKWTDEQKEDMSMALAEVLMEKGVAPTPTQELLLITLTVLGGQAMTLFTLKSQTNSLLNQLRAMNEGGGNYQASYEEPPTQPQAPMSNVSNEVPQNDNDENEITEVEQLVDIDEGNFEALNGLENMTEEDVLISDDNIETKE